MYSLLSDKPVDDVDGSECFCDDVDGSECFCDCDTDEQPFFCATTDVMFCRMLSIKILSAK